MKKNTALIIATLISITAAEAATSSVTLEQSLPPRIDANQCLNTKDKFLIQRSLVPINVENQCNVSQGLWADKWNKVYITHKNDAQLYRVVSLEYAWQNGAKDWKQEKREAFSKDIQNLILVKQGTPKENVTLSNNIKLQNRIQKIFGHICQKYHLICPK